jgi:hypothetical protein
MFLRVFPERTSAKQLNESSFVTPFNFFTERDRVYYIIIPTYKLD